MRRANLISYWTIAIILTNMFHVHVAVCILSSLNTEMESHQERMGLATFLAWGTLNSYIMHYQNYAYLPNTVLRSIRSVLNGIIGIFPIAFGLACFMGVSMSWHFRFKDAWTALFSMSYFACGDTVFDSLYGSDQVNHAITFIWCFLWLLFANNVIVNLTLAQVEDGYLDQKFSDRFDWIKKPIRDPEY